MKKINLEIFTIKDNQVLTITYVAEESQYHKFLSTVEKIIDSISFQLPEFPRFCLGVKKWRQLSFHSSHNFSIKSQ